jgi:hypothetical protein
VEGEVMEDFDEWVMRLLTPKYEPNIHLMHGDGGIKLEELIKEMGFESEEEFFRLVASVPLDTKEKMKAFEDWKFNDGTKEGLMRLHNENKSL